MSVALGHSIAEHDCSRDEVGDSYRNLVEIALVPRLIMSERTTVRIAVVAEFDYEVVVTSWETVFVEVKTSLAGFDGLGLILHIKIYL